MESTLSADISALLGAFPKPRWPVTRRVTYAFGPRAAQTKCLVGLPPLARQRDLEQLVQHGASRFFIGDSVHLVIVAQRHEDVVTAVAFDRTTVDEALNAAVRLGLRDTRIVSWLSASAAAIRSGVATVRYDDHEVDVQCRDGGLVSLSRQSVRGDSSSIDIAMAATMIGGRNALAVRRTGNPRRSAPPWRTAVGLLTLTMACAALLAAPFIRDARVVRGANAEALTLREGTLGAVRALAELNRISNLLDEAAAFQRASGSPLRLLSAITHGLPEDAALVAFNLDSAGGSLVAVAGKGMDVVALLDSLPSVRNPLVIGAMTRERIADQDLERVAIRFSRSQKR